MRSVCSLFLETAQQIVPSLEDFDMPTLNVYKDSQTKSPSSKDGLNMDESDGLWKHKGRIWIPGDDIELQLKVLVGSHCGTIGHRGMDATRSILQEGYWWKNMSKDSDALVRGCLHCIMTRSGDLVPRPLAHALHGEHPNEVVHADFLYMGTGVDQKRYILILKDDLSGYVWLWPTEEATGHAAAEAFAVWVGCFGSMEWLCTDQGTHFKNQLVAQLTVETRTHHHFTTAYSPWANGSVERVCREVIRACKAMTSEWRLAAEDWPAVTECVQSVLNHSPSKRLGLRDDSTPGVFRSPLEVFTGHLPKRPLLRAMPLQDLHHARSENEVAARQLIGVNTLQNALNAMHREVVVISSAQRKRHVELHNRKTNVRSINLQVGDFVLVRKAKSSGHKLDFTWRGPRRVTECRSDSVYEVENLLSGKREIVHSRRLMLYRAYMDGKPVDEALLRAAEHSETTYQKALALCGITEARDGIRVMVEWEGLLDLVDRTWEPLTQVLEDLPRVLEDFLCTEGNRDIKQKAQALCGFN